MEKTDRNDKGEAQKAKLIFLSLAVVVAIILIWSFVSANNARKERDAARQETEMLKQDNAKLEQLLKDQGLMNDDLKKKVLQCETKLKEKPVAKKAAPKSSKSAKKSKSKKSK
jgi:regulatory protein YycI of two-component signal transduction system YycFG